MSNKLENYLLSKIKVIDNYCQEKKPYSCGKLYSSSQIRKFLIEKAILEDLLAMYMRGAI